MKHFLLSLFLICSSWIVFSQKPEQVYSIAVEVREIPWYEQQLILWKNEIDKNKQNGVAWTNYYMAARALRNLSGSDPEQLKRYQQKCIEITEEVHKAYPDSFEDYYLNYINSGFSQSDEKLLKAAALRPYDERILDEMMIHHALTFNEPGFETYCLEMFKANNLAAGILNWGHNILSELDANAILFTFGDNDTYAAWINQGAFNFRKDITVINTSLILLDDYRNQLMQKLELPPFTVKLEEVGFDAFNQKLFQHIFDGTHPVYVSNTGISIFPESFKDKLYLTGLSHKYSTEPIDVNGLIIRNYENRYLLDYLQETFSFHIANAKANDFSASYLPSLVKLYQHYSQTEEYTKQQKAQQLLIKLAEQSGQQSEVMELLETSKKNNPVLYTLLDIKTLEKNMVPISGNWFMGKYEVSQGEYNRFLNNLQRSGNLSQYQTCLYDSTQWIKGKLAHDFNEPMQNLYHWHPAYENYPVVNISFEAAKAYCQWLTEQYNTQRKRTYTQVLFRLPTEEEWRTAAGSGNPKARTPFTDDKIQNPSGCYLINIQTSPGRFYDDGGFHTVKVISYNPNKLGMYNTMGNAAEMTATPGVSLGGSWYNLLEDCYFNKTQAYTGPNPFTGFRIVMEIIQE